MPKVMVPRKHTKFYNAYSTIIVLMWVFVGFYFGAFDNDSELPGEIRFLYFAVIFILLSVFSWLRKVEFKCPSCGTSIPKPVDEYVKGGDPIYHYCKKCDVLWHVDNEVVDG